MKKSEIIKEIVKSLIEKKETEFRYGKLFIDVSVQNVYHRLWQGKAVVVRIDIDVTLALAESQNRYIIVVSPDAMVPDAVKVINGIFRELAKYLETKIEIKNYVDLDWDWIVETPSTRYAVYGLPWTKYPHVVYENEKVTVAYYNVTKVINLTDEDIEKYRTIDRLRDEVYKILDEFRTKNIDLDNLWKEIRPTLETIFRLGFMIPPDQKKAYIDPAMSDEDLRKLLDTLPIQTKQLLDKIKKLYLKSILTS